MLGWGMGFSFLWAALGSFIFGSEFSKALGGPPADHYLAVLYYTAGWFSSISLYSFSSLAVGLTLSLFYSTASVAYALKFTKLTPTRYHVCNIIGAITMCLMLSLFNLASVYGLYSYSFQVNLYPRNVPFVMISSIFAGTFFYLLSMFLTLLCIVIGRPKLVMTIAYVPMIFAIIFSYVQLYSYFTWIETIFYLSPFSNIASLLSYGYTDAPIPITFTNPDAGYMSVDACLASLSCWLMVLALIDIYLIKEVREVSPYEFF